MKIWLITSIICIGIIHALAQESKANCGTNLWECANGYCVSLSYICDGDNDCGDNSDELDPETGTCPRCPDNYFQCANGRCMNPSTVCDRKDNCGDMSDEPEDPDLCPECPRGQANQIFLYDFRCANGRCTPESNLCNGVENCEDGSDEPEDPDLCPACETYQFRCSNGRCISNSNLCNGVDNCGDGSDEPDNPDLCPACETYQFRCKSGRCIHESWVCDGDNDCVDWSDESEEICPCADGQVRCPTPPSEEPSPPGLCIPEDVICDKDGIWDCPDGSDEANCTVNSSGHHII